MNRDFDHLCNHLIRISRHLRLRDGLRLAAMTLWPAALLVTLAELTARYWPLPDRHLWAVLPLEGWLLGVALFSLLRPLPLWRVARRLDTEFRLKDRLATALELHSPSTIHHPPLAMNQLQLTDALFAAGKLDPHALPWQIPRRPLWLAGSLLTIALLLALWPNPMDAVLAEQATIQETAREQARAIEAARREVEAQTAPTSEERAKALRALEELMKALADNPGDLEQALAALATAQQQLRELESPAAGSQAAALAELAKQLTALSRGEEEASGDLDDAGEALAELAAALDQMDAGEREALATSLERMAASAAATNADLAEALLEMAAAARAGDPSAAGQAAKVAQAALVQADQQADLDAALATAQAAVEESRRQLAAAGGQGNNNTTAQGNGNAGQGNQAGGSQGVGQTPGQGNQVGGGGGSTANQLPGTNRTGAAGDPTQPNRPDGSASGPTSSETVYAPGAHPPGESEFVAGTETGEGEVSVREEEAPQPGAANPSLVPYSTVYENYATAAGETMEHERVPPEWRNYVRDYFTQLAPEQGQP
jgi:hypothetical protein